MKKELIKLITSKLIKSPAKAKPKAGKLSAKAKKVQECIAASDFGCKKQAVTSLMSIVLGEDISPLKMENMFKPGQVLKIVADSTDHEYATGSFVAVVKNNEDGDEIWVDSGEANDSEDLKYIASIDAILATPAEIKQFISSLSSRTEKQLVFMLTSLTNG